jgi:hypothetical protein
MLLHFFLVALQVTEQKLAEVFSNCGQVSSVILLRKNIVVDFPLNYAMTDDSIWVTFVTFYFIEK